MGELCCGFLGCAGCIDSSLSISYWYFLSPFRYSGVSGFSLGDFLSSVYFLICTYCPCHHFSEQITSSHFIISGRLFGSGIWEQRGSAGHRSHGGREVVARSGSCWALAGCVACPAKCGDQKSGRGCAAGKGALGQDGCGRHHGPPFHFPQITAHSRVSISGSTF